MNFKKGYCGLSCLQCIQLYVSKLLADLWYFGTPSGIKQMKSDSSPLTHPVFLVPISVLGTWKRLNGYLWNKCMAPPDYFPGFGNGYIFPFLLQYQTLQLSFK